MIVFFILKYKQNTNNIKKKSPALNSYPLVFFTVICQYIDMKCPICGSKGLKTTNSRPTLSGNQTWRRKQCPKCQSSITTYEKADLGWLSIKDNSGSSMKTYKKALLYKSLIDSLDANELHEIDVDNLIDSIEQKIVSKHKTIITKKELIKIVLDTIKPISLKAYIKYLTNHSRLHNKRELNSLLKDI